MRVDCDDPVVVHMCAMVRSDSSDEVVSARRDPRLERSREAILDAATELLSEGGVGRVTIDAITARSGVARSTLYRHFPTSTDVLAVAFQRLLPPLQAPATDAPLRERLLTLVKQQAAQIDNAPTLAAVIWMATSEFRPRSDIDRREYTHLDTLRQRIVDRYREPFDPVLRECLPTASHTGAGDIDRAAACLIGPLLFNALITRKPSDDAFCTRIVDDFVATHR